MIFSFSPFALSLYPFSFPCSFDYDDVPKTIVATPVLLTFFGSQSKKCSNLQTIPGSYSAGRITCGAVFAMLHQPDVANDEAFSYYGFLLSAAGQVVNCPLQNAG